MNYLKSKQVALLIAASAVLLVLTPNTTAVFNDLSSFDNWVGLTQAIAYSFFLEAGIIWFALRSRILPVGIFMIISTVIHLAYYKIISGMIVPVTIAISLPLMVFLIAEETRRDVATQKRNAKVRKEKPVKKLNKQERIKELLQQGMTDAQVAQQTGVNRSTVYRIRIGKSSKIKAA